MYDKLAEVELGEGVATLRQVVTWPTLSGWLMKKSTDGQNRGKERQASVGGDQSRQAEEDRQRRMGEDKVTTTGQIVRSAIGAR